MRHPSGGVRALCAALGLAALAVAAPAGAFSQVLVFGDSLSDSGNTTSNFDAAPGGTCASPFLSPSPPYVGGACSNGPTWAEVMAQALGLAAEPATAGGTNYAVGGASAASDVAGTSLGDLDGEAEDIGDQLGRFLADHPVADPDALYVIVAGGNDIQLTARGAIAFDPDVIAHAVGAMLDVAGQLSALGAQHFLFGSIYDLGNIPEPDPAYDHALATALTQQLATQLPLAVAGFAAASVAYVDFGAVADSIRADPAAYGLGNTTDPCVLPPNPFNGNPGNVNTVCGQSLAIQDTYFWMDNIHPTRVVHAVFAEAALAALAAVPEPGGLRLCATMVALGLTLRRRLPLTNAEPPRGRRCRASPSSASRR